jgi:hypothetical protein
VKYTFVFVCQRGPLEVQAMLLAASLAENLRCDHRLVAALPEPEETWGRPREETLRFLERLGVARVPVQNHVSCELPVTNKLSCLDVEHEGDVTVYIDADMLCMKPFSGAAGFEGEFGARAAGFDCFAEHGRSDETWTALYAHFGLPLPEGRVTATAARTRRWRASSRPTSSPLW